MSKDTIIASYLDEDKKRVEIKVSDYENLVKNKDQQKISKMIFHRFYERYINPFTFPADKDKADKDGADKDGADKYRREYKNGFAMMANGCLLIEALESFYQGWETTRYTGDKTFKSFFGRFYALRKFQRIDFYKHIRCGILHQAETTGGYKIRRRGPIFDNKTKTINASKFLEQLNSCLEEYQKKLSEAEWDSEIWDNFRRKMRSIIKNCDET